jgi:hypothetical protein
MQNLARPTGFMFSMAKGKKSDDLEGKTRESLLKGKAQYG